MQTKHVLNTVKLIYFVFLRVQLCVFYSCPTNYNVVLSVQKVLIFLLWVFLGKNHFDI